MLVAEREWPRRALEALLVREGYAVVRVERPATLAAFVESVNPDVVFVDVGTAATHDPHPDDPLQALAGCGPGRSTPLVAFTADTPTRDARLAAVRAGAWDAITIPTDAELLLARCETWVRSKRAADVAREARLVDRETGLYTLAGVVHRSRDLLALAQRAERPAPAVACIALRARQLAAAPPWADDRAAAAEPASAIGLAMRDVFEAVGRSSDVFARVGHHDFVVVAAGADAAVADRIAGRLADAVRARTSGDPRRRVALAVATRTLPARGSTPADLVDLVLRTAVSLDGR